MTVDAGLLRVSILEAESLLIHFISVASLQHLLAIAVACVSCLQHHAGLKCKRKLWPTLGAVLQARGTVDTAGVPQIPPSLVHVPSKPHHCHR
jgi:hypothetical protein